MTLVVYKDRDFDEPFKIENLGDVEAGDVKVLEGYLYNDSKHSVINIEYETADRDVHLFNVPEMLKAGSWEKIEIKYAPDRLRTTPLNTFVTFRGKERIPPE